jgi:hypothetical protein
MAGLEEERAVVPASLLALARKARTVLERLSVPVRRSALGGWVVSPRLLLRAAADVEIAAGALRCGVA